MRRRGCGSSVTVKPRNERCHGRATALFCALTWSLRRPSMKRVKLVMTRWPAVSLRTPDFTVVRVAHEAVAASLKFAIQFVQHEIREQGREWTTLRGPL